MTTNGVNPRRAAFLAAATQLHETEVPSGALGLGNVLIRELTALQKYAALDAAKLYDSEGNAVMEGAGAAASAKMDNATYYAVVIQCGLLDREGAQRDEADALIPGSAPLLLLPDDVPTLAEQGREALRLLANAILNLSWLSVADMVRLRPRPDVARDESTDTSAGAAEATAGRSPARRKRVTDERAPVGDPVLQGDGADV